jgi:hypothetical protein
MLFPAAASRGTGHGGDDHGYGGKCGYGQVEDNDENENTSAVQRPNKPDHDCDEDENDGSDGGGDRNVGSRNQASVTVAKHYVVASNRLRSNGE